MKHIIEEIAKQNGVSKEEVIRDIQEAISIAMQSENAEAKAFWKQLAPDGKQPPIETVIRAIVSQLKSI
ncbi:MAG: sporulation initiation factor Spo0A C-terminal domain-containing protein [Candidatus Fimenecus sp.]